MPTKILEIMIKKGFAVLSALLLMSSSLNVEAQTYEEISCFKGAHLAANALGDLYGLSYEMEYNLFENLLEACIENGGWN